MFGPDVSEFMTLIKDHGLIFLTKQGRADIVVKPAELSQRIPRKLVLQFLGSSIKKTKVSNEGLSGR